MNTQPSVTAGGAGLLPARFEEFAGDRVQLEVTAQQRPDGSPQGRLSYVHHNAPGVLARGRGIVTCLLLPCAPGPTVLDVSQGNITVHG